ncbi:MAG: Beta-galactosidase/beta-glucuronidase protein [Chlorobi bacterium]|nr:Beta-galactosidase/beta-glucuronidase protein [Chlorobiota bacterium]
MLFVISALNLGAQTQPKGFLKPPPAPDNSVYSSLTSSPTRSVISLNGTWQVSDDGGDTKRSVQVPSSFNGQDNLVFTRTFQIPPDMLQNYQWRIVCFGVQYQTTISINGQFVSQHESGMPFTIKVPDEVKLATTNTIRVEVTNRLDYTSTVPLRKLLLGNRTYGGIFRDMVLLGVPKVWINDVRFQTVLNGANAEAKFNVQVVSAAIKGMRIGGGGDSGAVETRMTEDRGDFELGIGIRRPGGSDSVQAQEVGRGTQTFGLESKRTASIALSIPVTNAELWAPSSPNLYQAVLQVRYKGVLVDEQTMNVGFRTLTVSGTQIILNGGPITLKGVVYLEDSQDYGASLPYEMMKKDIQSIKDMGVNLIRFADGVPHPYLLQLCDQLGVMAFVDISMGTPPAALFSDENYMRRSLDRVRFTVDEAGHSTCVVAYGLSAVIPGNSDKALKAVGRLKNALDSLDHRLFYFASSSWANPQLRKLADIPGMNVFDIDPPKLRDMIVAAKKDLNGEKPFVLLGYGKFVQLGNHTGSKDPISIEAQAIYISDVYTILQQTETAGGIYWAFNDYRTDRPILTVNNEEQYLATCGVYGLGRDLRQGAEMLSNLYTDQKPPNVLLGDYSPPSTVIFIAIGIGCAIVFLLLINSSRRFRENVFRALLRPYNFYADIRDQRILSNVQTTILGLVIALTFALIVASLCYYYRMDESFDATLSAIVTSDFIKEFLNYIIWRPALSITIFTLFFFGLLLLVALIIRACAALVRNRIFFTDAYIISVWGALPVLLLIVPAMILYRLLGVPGAGPIAFLVMMIVVLWMVYRVLRGTAVIYDVRPLKVYGYAIGTVCALFLVLYVTSGETSTAFSYLREGIGGLYTGR